MYLLVVNFAVLLGLLDSWKTTYCTPTERGYQDKV